MTGTITVKPSGQACGAEVTGVDLSQPLPADVIKEIRDAWLEHHVLAFPDQHLNHDQFEAFASQFGDFGEDPYFNPLPGRQYIAAVRREAADETPIFAENWHSDWSFLPEPPSATLLYSIDIPPQGGDTHFSNQHLSFEKMPAEMKEKYEGLTAIHSAVLGYSPEGIYGDVNKNGSMDITPSEDAYKQEKHPLVPPHPETGRKGFLSGVSYIIGFEGMADEESRPLIMELNDWQSKEEFLYRHKWQNGMLVMWDNRSVIHKATGGYEGHRRELHRITIY